MGVSSSNPNYAQAYPHPMALLYVLSSSYNFIRYKHSEMNNPYEKSFIILKLEQNLLDKKNFFATNIFCNLLPLLSRPVATLEKGIQQ
jgi:hypothetical protein